MTAEVTYEPACSGKAGYDNAHGALVALATMNKRKRPNDGRILKHYRCPVCSRWHVGSSAR